MSMLMLNLNVLYFFYRYLSVFLFMDTATANVYLVLHFNDWNHFSQHNIPESIIHVEYISMHGWQMVFSESTMYVKTLTNPSKSAKVLY